MTPTPVPPDAFVVVGVLVVVYLLPALIASARGVPGLVRPTLVWGWTGIGWVVALGLALSRPGVRRHPTGVQRSRR